MTLFNPIENRKIVLFIAFLSYANQKNLFILNK